MCMCGVGGVCVCMCGGGGEDVWSGWGMCVCMCGGDEVRACACVPVEVEVHKIYTPHAQHE